MKNLSLVGLAAYLYWFAQYQWTLKAILWLVAWIWSGGYRLVYVTFHTWRRDLRYIYLMKISATYLISTKNFPSNRIIQRKQLGEI